MKPRATWPPAFETEDRACDWPECQQPGVVKVRGEFVGKKWSCRGHLGPFMGEDGRRRRAAEAPASAAAVPAPKPPTPTVAERAARRARERQAVEFTQRVPPAKHPSWEAVCRPLEIFLHRPRTWPELSEWAAAQIPRVTEDLLRHQLAWLSLRGRATADGIESGNVTWRRG